MWSGRFSTSGTDHARPLDKKFKGVVSNDLGRGSADDEKTDRRTKEALAGAMLDTIQLPGMSLSKVANNMGDLVSSLREMMED